MSTLAWAHSHGGSAEGVNSRQASQCLPGEGGPLVCSTELADVHALLQASQQLHDPQEQIEIWRELCDATLFDGALLIEWVHPPHSVKHAIRHPCARVLVVSSCDDSEILQCGIYVIFV